MDEAIKRSDIPSPVARRKLFWMRFEFAWCLQPGGVEEK